MKKITLILLMFLMIDIISYAQLSQWKRARYEFFGGLGVTNFLGELGGSDQEAATFLKDLELSQTRVGGTLGMKYMLTRDFSVLSAFSFGYVRGDDSKTNNEFRQNRNLHFRSPIVELQGRLQYTIIKDKKGARYNLKKVRGKPGNNITLDFFAGVAGFWFNPQAQYLGKWYNLQPLGTEGQNYIDTRTPYSRISLALPVGFNVRYIVNRNWSVALDFGPRFTFTDYIDDVSGTYADAEKIIAAANNNFVAGELADPSLKRNTEPNLTAAGQQRGNSFDDDIYMFLFVTVNYKVKTGRNGLPRFK